MLHIDVIVCYIMALPSVTRGEHREMTVSNAPRTKEQDILSMLELPKIFPASERDKAEFWAWLSEQYLIRVRSDQLPKSGEKEGRFRIVSKEDLRQLIGEALETDDQGWADELLQLASGSQQIGKEIVRKSIRVQKGEYLKMLYVKLIENSSFSDVILKLLQRPARSYVSALRSKLSHASRSVDLRLDHLFSQIDTWDKAKPESRTRSVDLASTILDETGYIPAQYSLKLDDIKPAVSSYALGEVERKILRPGMQYLRKIYEEEFQARWRSGIEESVPQGIALKPTPSPSDSNAVLFTPLLNYYEVLDERQTQKLFEKYGEDTVLAFASSFHAGKESEAYGENIHKLIENEKLDLTISWEVELPSFSASVQGPSSISEDATPNISMDRCISEDDMILWNIIEKVAKKVGLKPNALFSRERDAGRQGTVAGSPHLTDFVKLATKNASDPEDFSDIRMITTVRNRILSYQKVKSFVEDLILQTLARRSVVSFYVNTDVWRLIPIVMESKNWLTLADEFLKLRPSQKQHT